MSSLVTEKKRHQRLAGNAHWCESHSTSALMKLHTHKLNIFPYLRKKLIRPIKKKRLIAILLFNISLIKIND